MPYYSFDPETFEEYAEYGVEVNKEQYDEAEDGSLNYYEPASGTFEPEKLTGQAKLSYQVLQAIEVVGVYCNYDGGGDEGFAHFDTAVLPNGQLSLMDLMSRLSDGILGGDLQLEAYLQDYYNKLEPEVRVKDSLNWLAYELAAALLGGGYGTGDYSMQGRFYADFNTKRINDLKELPE